MYLRVLFFLIVPFFVNAQITAKSYHDNGELKVIGELVNRKESGMWTWYYDSGKIETIGYFENGKPRGDWQYFYPSGTLKTAGDYSEGLKEGIWLHYSEKGLLQRKEWWEKDILVKTEVY